MVVKGSAVVVTLCVLYCFALDAFKVWSLNLASSNLTGI